MPAHTPASLQTVFLLPFPLTKAQHGAWWSAALDEGLANHGECYWRIDLMLAFQQWEESRPGLRPPADWHPDADLEHTSTEAWPLQPGCMLTFKGIEGVVLELHTDEGLVYFGFDAVFFDAERQWKDVAARDLLLGLFPGNAQPAPPRVEEPVALATPDRLARGEALLEFLRKH